MQTIRHEPSVAVGLMSGVTELRFELHGEFTTPDQISLRAGSWRAAAGADRQITLTDGQGGQIFDLEGFNIRPADPAAASFTIRDIVIGVDFHWQRREDQQFRGALRLKVNDQGGLVIINEVAVEDYLRSVISSEMSASAHAELLQAHAIISRSWLLAQLPPWKLDHGQSSLDFGVRTLPDGSLELIRWYDREAHADFDVCADDHCQRYQGMTKAAKTPEGATGLQKVREAISATYGRVLAFGDSICDARFSKSCGGMVEQYRAAWEDADIPYLVSLYDGESLPAGYRLPLTDETNAENWIVNSPPAWCHTDDRTILQRILPDFDQETTDFYRWQVVITQTELQKLLREKLGIDFGAIRSLDPLERGPSGRVMKLRIVGEKATIILGKELEIRRALSQSHLYSSAFVVRAEGSSGEIPDAFRLLGAGWGHGVGLCQIGAALMAERGIVYQQILAHYYPGAQIIQLYSPAADAVN